MVTVLDVERTVAPGIPWDRAVACRFRDTLDDRYELNETRATLVAQEAVNLAAANSVGRMDGCERVPLDSCVAQAAQAPHHIVEGPPSTLVYPVRVVDLPRAVNREAHEEVVLAEERGPVGIEKGAVRLDRVLGPLTRLQIKVDE